jgi:hypothetical protein
VKKTALICITMAAVLVGAWLLYSDHPLNNTSPAGGDEAQAAGTGLFPAPAHTVYTMDLYLEPASATLFGKTRLSTVNSSGQPLEYLWFSLYPNAFRNPDQSPAPAAAYYAGFDPGWLQVESVVVNGKKADSEEQGMSLRVLLSRPVQPGEKLEIILGWQARIPRLAYRYGSKDGVFMLGNFYPTLNVLDEQGWHLAYNSRFGDPFCFHTADYLVRVNLPQEYQMVSTGRQMDVLAQDDGRVIYLVAAEKVRDFCLVVLYDYHELSNQSRGIKTTCFFPARGEYAAAGILNESIQALDYYASIFGSYPYPEFKVVFVPMQGFRGMEYSGMIFLQEEFLQPASDPGYGEFILAHEIAHQWWYGMVGNDQLKEPWLDEGLANWSANKYLSKNRGREIPDAGEFKNGVNLDRSLADMYSQPEYYRTAYTGGEAFWLGLEKELGGEEAVFKVLRKYLADYRYCIATTRDLCRVIKEESRQDISKYLSQWF